MNWQVSFSKNAKKQLTRLPKNVMDATLFLAREIEMLGPLRHNWKNFGKLRGSEDRYHCHVKQGKPTYVACWEIKDKKVKIIEVYYAGTHEGAPY